MFKIRHFTTFLVLFSLLLASCGKETADSDDASQSPLEEALGLEAGFLLDGMSGVDSAEKHLEQQESIAVCMKAEGFEYIPVPLPEGVQDASEQYELRFTKEWVEEWGFGVSTEIFSQEQVGSSLKGFDDSFITETLTEDPNIEILTGLSEADKQAYDEALYGYSGDDASLADPDEMLEVMSDSCSLGSIGEEESTMIDFYQAFDNELEDMFEQAMQDPAIREEAENIDVCLADKGFVVGAESILDDDMRSLDLFSDLDSLEEEVRGLPFDESDFGIEDALSNRGQDATSATTVIPGEEIDFEEFEFPAEDLELTEEQKSRLAAIQEEEIELALIAFECGYPNDMESKGREVFEKYEKEFVDKNKSKIEEFKK